MKLTNQTVSSALAVGRRALFFSYFCSRRDGLIRGRRLLLGTRQGTEACTGLRSMVMRKFSSRTPANRGEQQKRKNPCHRCGTIEEELSLSTDHGFGILDARLMM